MIYQPDSGVPVSDGRVSDGRVERQFQELAGLVGPEVASDLNQPDEAQTAVEPHRSSVLAVDGEPDAVEALGA